MLLGAMVHICNPSYLGDGGNRIVCLQQGKNPNKLKNTLTQKLDKNQKGWSGRVLAQHEGCPGFPKQRYLCLNASAYNLVALLECCIITLYSRILPNLDKKM
jgi:hypothetical protein